MPLRKNSRISLSSDGKSRQDLSNTKQLVNPLDRLAPKTRHTIFFPMVNQANPTERKGEKDQGLVDLEETVEPPGLKSLTTRLKGSSGRSHKSDTTGANQGDVLPEANRKIPERASFSLNKCLQLGLLLGVALSKMPSHQAGAVRIEGCSFDSTLNISHDSSTDILADRLETQFNQVFPILMKRFAQNPCDPDRSQLSLEFASLPGREGSIPWTYVRNTTDNCISAHVGTIQLDIKKNGGVNPSNKKPEGVLTHELTHVTQAYPLQSSNSSEFEGLREGIAEYARRIYGPKNDQYEPESLNSRSNWTDGPVTTAVFLSWLEQTKRSTIVDDLNRMLQNCSFTPNAFSQLIGQDVNSAWEDYKGIKLAEQHQEQHQELLKKVVPPAVLGPLLLLAGIYVGYRGIKKYKNRAQSRQPDIELGTNEEGNS
jgi:Plant Basic Secretory Protein.